MSHGATRRNADRSGYDYYKTPVKVIEDLISHARLYPGFSNHAIDPACGSGTISQALQRAGWAVTAWDIRADDDVYGRKGVDFLTLDPLTLDPAGTEFGQGLIVCNPPYNIAQEFIDHALKTNPSRAYFLLRLTWAASSRRKEWLRKAGLCKVHVLTKRPKMWDARKPEPSKGGMVDYAWFCFVPGYRGPVEMDWI